MEESVNGILTLLVLVVIVTAVVACGLAFLAGMPQ